MIHPRHPGAAASHRIMDGDEFVVIEEVDGGAAFDGDLLPLNFDAALNAGEKRRVGSRTRSGGKTGMFYQHVRKKEEKKKI